ncbi:MAG: glycogen/starch synthase [Bacteroidales bacterium]|nr:glycogen/starch synthase [Bacteroidales bacterium]MDD4656856.1 glycogen/starch synthase [Bacteroidales bacterium]
MNEPKRILYVSSEIFPYLPETTISKVGRFLPQGAQERGFEIRSFMPKYGVINERRNQLHEVIRLSGMNIIINDLDRPLIIKVSSISSARMQVYFIDNEDYFARKFVYGNEDTKHFPDNDERAIFFARGVLETVKKLRWKPDIIHCQGWISHFLPLYLRKVYAEDPIFTDSKIILSLYNEGLDQEFNEKTISKVLVPGIKNKDLDALAPANGINLAKLAMKYSDAIIVGEEELDKQLKDIAEGYSLPSLDYIDTSDEESNYMDEYIKFYNKIFAKR